MEKDFYPAYFEVEGRHWWFVGRRKLFLRVLEQRFPPNARPIDVLDFGCGTGAFLEHLDRFGAVSAVDADSDAVAFCRTRGRTEVLHTPPGAPLPFGDGSFDLVTTLDVIEHIEDDVGALIELRRLLKPGGALLVAVPAYRFLWGKQDEVSHHHRRYTARLLGRKLAAAGFDLDRTSYFNTALFLPVAVVRVARRLLRMDGGALSDFETGPARLNSILGAVFGSEAAIASRVRLPFGVSVMALARKP
jgi:SAM-dependent methyltransferase